MGTPLFHFREIRIMTLACWWKPMLCIVIPPTLFRAWYSHPMCVLNYIIVCLAIGHLYHKVNLLSKLSKYLINLILRIFTNCVPVNRLSAVIAICSNSSNLLNRITKTVEHQIFLHIRYSLILLILWM